MELREEWLFEAIENNNLKEVKELINGGVSIHITDDSSYVSVDKRTMQRSTGWTPLELAKKLRRSDIVDYLNELITKEKNDKTKKRNKKLLKTKKTNLQASYI